jgi:acetyltransferase-like isoleucine patch superfamily enzyme
MKHIISRIKSNVALKDFSLRLLMPKNQARPRLWVKLFLNPLAHKIGKGAIIRTRTRMDVLPFRAFILGDNSTIEDFSTINNGMGKVEIGSNSRVGISNVIIGPVTIGNHVIMAQNVVLSGLNHSYEDISMPISKQKCTTAEIIIEDEAWIGANAVITAGVKIGKHSVVAGGSVVTKDVPPYSIVGGNPARILKMYNPETGIWEKPSGERTEAKLKIS